MAPAGVKRAATPGRPGRCSAARGLAVCLLGIGAAVVAASTAAYGSARLTRVQLTRAQMAAHALPADTKVIAYLASWAIPDKNFDIGAIRADRLTHLVYAFGRVTQDGRAALEDPCLDAGQCPPDVQPAVAGGNFAALRALKERYPKLRILISLGGWDGSAHFSDAAASPEARERLVSSAIDVFINGQPGLFDGFDIDWEYPSGGGREGNAVRPDDGANLIRLAEEFRRHLDALPAPDGQKYELALAVSAAPGRAAGIEAARLAKIADWLGIMSYDYHAGSTLTHFNAPLFTATDDPTPGLNVDASVHAYLDAGVPAGRMVLGIPFYGRAYGNVARGNDGLFRKADPNAPTVWSSNEIDYRTLMAGHLQDRGFARYWNRDAQVPWLYNPAAGVWITYDGPDSVTLKARYAHKHGLAGIMIWELSADDGSLLMAVRRGLETRPLSANSAGRSLPASD